MSVVVVFFASIGTAAAQSEDPLRLVFVNSDPSDGTGVFDAVAGLLDASKDIELIDSEELMAAGEERGVSLETFRDGDRRKQNANAFKEMIAQSSAEAIMVLDVFGGGHTMQLVIIGPYGDELADLRQKIAGSRPTQAESVEALRKVFKTLVPEVRRFREDEARRQEQSASVDLLGEEEEPEDQSIKQRVVREHRQNHGNLEAGVTPTVGMIFGRRNLLLDTQADYQLDHASPFVGFGAEISTIFALMDGDTAAIGATFFGAYAPFTTVFTAPSGQPLELPSAYSDLRLDLKYIKGVGADVVLSGKIGAERMTVSIDQNDAYTGNSYMNLRVGAGLIYQFGQLAELHLDAAVLPTLSAELSGDAMGPSDFELGFNGGGRLHLTLLKPVDVSIGYDLQYYAATYATPNLEELDGQAATTTDMVHLANIMIGYGF